MIVGVGVGVRVVIHHPGDRLNKNKKINSLKIQITR